MKPSSPALLLFVAAVGCSDELVEDAPDLGPEPDAGSRDGGTSPDAGPNDAGVPPPKPILRLPVVVHVIHPTEESNISLEKIQSQIEVTNQHLRAANHDELATVPAAHQPFIGDARLELYLAEVDPEGDPTTGVQRRGSQLSLPNSVAAKHCHAEQGGIDAWPPERYINVWVGDSTTVWGDIGIAGLAFIPGFTDRPRDEWGIQVDYRAFGTLEPLEPGLHQGKTFTHELGHYLGLIGHTQESVEGGHRNWTCDGEPDTPCHNRDLSESFMSAQVDDPVLKMFSLSQVAAMRSQLGPEGELADLGQSVGGF